MRSNHNTDQLASEAHNSPLPVFSRIEILIVDDNIFNLSTLQTMIKMKFGLESTTVCSGQLAIKSVIDQPKAEDEPPFKIIFMDCNMPQMDGFETTKKIIEICQREGMELPYIVALTAHSQTDKVVKTKCYENGMNQCLTKPISFDKIRELFIRLNIDFKLPKK